MQTAIVILILLATLAFVVRWVARQAKGQGGCSCGCSHCPMNRSGGCHCNGKKQKP